MHLIRRQFFIIGLLVAVLLALVVPEPGAKGGWLVPELSTKLGVAMIFFLQGLGLATKQMLSGLQPIRLHLFCQSWNFLAFPLLTGLVLLPLGPFLEPELILGFWMLSILPTTISSATALTVVAEGAVPQSIFSSVLSNLLAILLVPAFGLLLLGAQSGGAVPLLPVFAQLLLLVVFPLFLGQAFRRIGQSIAVRIGGVSQWLTQLIILFIVYTSFAESLQSGALTALNAPDIMGAIVTISVLLVLSALFVWWSSRWLGVEKPLRVAAFYCASQKSLATGLPLLKSIFLAAGAEEKLAVVLIPLILFHPAQLLIGAWLADRFKRTAHCSISACSQ